VIVAVPAATPVTSPVELTVAFVVSELAQVTCELRFCVELSANVPVAVSCVVAPVATVGLAGVTAMLFKAEAVTVTTAVLERPPDDAVIVAVPSPVPALLAVTRPAVTVATALFDVVHVAVELISELVPPTVVAVAVNCCVSFTFMNRLVGARVIESSALFEGKKLSQAPRKIINTNKGRKSRTRFMNETSRMLRFYQQLSLINPRPTVLTRYLLITALRIDDAIVDRLASRESFFHPMPLC
jgi:hypothetical protein